MELDQMTFSLKQIQFNPQRPIIQTTTVFPESRNWPQ